MAINKILKNTSLYTLCALLQKGTGFLLLPIYTTYLKPEDYGTMNLILSVRGEKRSVSICGRSENE